MNKTNTMILSVALFFACSAYAVEDNPRACRQACIAAGAAVRQVVSDMNQPAFNVDAASLALQNVINEMTAVLATDTVTIHNPQLRHSAAATLRTAEALLGQILGRRDMDAAGPPDDAMEL